MNKEEQIQQIQLKKRSNVAIVVLCVVFVSCMIGAAYAAVPLYDLFCRVTGYGGTTQQSESADITPIERMITINFDANVVANLPWKFKSVKKQR